MRKRNASSLHWKGVDILRIRIFIAALLIAALAVQPAFAGSLQESFTFTTTDTAYKNYTVSDIGRGELADIPKEKKSRLRIKKASDIKFTVISKDETKEKTYTKLTAKKVPKTYKDKNGKKYYLLKTEWSEEERKPATHSVNYRGEGGKPSAPSSISFDVTFAGKTFKTKGNLVSFEKSGESYSKPFTVTAKFVGDDDISGYVIGGRIIPKNDSTPVFKGYESVLLSSLGLDSGKYRITSGRWKGEAKTENGETVRYAEFSGLRLAADYTAVYRESTANMPYKSSYEAVCTYGPNPEMSYEIRATVTYENAGLTTLGLIIAASVAIIVLAGLTVLILMFIAKRRKEATDEV